MLVGTLVDVVGIKAKDRGRSCPRHDCCSDQFLCGMKVKVLKERMRQRGDDEDDVLVVYLITDGAVGCKVEFLRQHLAMTRADDYDGLSLWIVEVYTDQCTSIIKCKKCIEMRVVALVRSLGNANVCSSNNDYKSIKGFVNSVPRPLLILLIFKS